MNQFVIAPDFQVFDRQELNQFDWYNEELYCQILKDGEGVLLNGKKKLMYVLNPVIRQFLQGFKQPATAKSVATSLAKAAGCDVAQLKDTVLDFMDDMYDSGIIVEEERRQKMLTLEAQKTKEKLNVGTLLEGYRIEQVLAEKAKITIYKATHSATGEQRVVKAMILDQSLKSKEKNKIKQHYLQEFKLIEEVHEHNGVCRFIEFIESGNTLLAVLEFVDGVSLKKTLKHRQLSLAEKIFLLEQFLSVMSTLHAKEVIHGDLHSNNLMITKDLEIKLIDFNLSNHAKPHKWEVLREGGVYQYLPPEKISEVVMDVVNGRADFRSEVFQMGVMIYLLFYEKMPFMAYRYKELGDAIKNEEVELHNNTITNESIPEYILVLLQKAMQKKPAMRFKSAVEMYTFYLAKASINK